MVRRLLFIAALIATTLLHANGGTKAAVLGPGDLDPTFGNGGKIVGLIGSAIAVQPDGKIVLAGTFASWISMEFGVMRLLPDGTPDATFGNGEWGTGFVVTDFEGRDDYANSLLLLPDGTIVVGGSANCSPYGQYECGFGLASYSSDGMEMARGTTFFETSAGVSSLASHNGEIVAAGGPYLLRSSLEGPVTTDMEWIVAVVFQPDGKLVASGWCADDAGTYFSCITRFGVDGSVDATFGDNGSVTDVEILGALTLQPDGKLLLAGGRSGDFVLARYNSDGSLDTSFGTAGRVSTDFGNNDHASAVALQEDGKIIAAGTTSPPGQFALARYDDGGNLDETFGSFGKVTTGFDNPNYTGWGATAVTVQPDGNIIAAGFGQWVGVYGVLPVPAMARYLGADQQSPLASLSIAPTSLISGDVATGTVTLATPQTGDVSVNLSSGDAALVTVPPNLTVPAGQTSATFTVSTNPVFTSATVEIGASLGDATREANLLLHAQTSVSDLLVGPAVVGGNPAVGTVYLTRPPGSTDAVEVTLASSDPGVASVPASVIVPGDATYAHFGISTGGVAATTLVTISANYQTTKSAVLTIGAAVISSVTLGSASVPAGTPSNGIVSLTGAAATGGAEVALASSEWAIVSVPATVTIPAGATSANFPVSTTACTSGAPTILAAYRGASASAVLTVTSLTDVVTIQRARYPAGKHELRVDATSTSSTATLDVLVTSSGAVIGRLTNLGGGSYSGRFTWPMNPQNITVRSSSCGSATKPVTS